MCGDSRVYLIREQIGRKITKDHSYVQQLVEDKKITREEAEHHPKKNMLLKALGCTSYVEPDIRARNVEKNDIFLMCSDGLTNMIQESKIYEVVEENKEKPDAVRGTLPPQLLQRGACEKQGVL